MVDNLSDSTQAGEFKLEILGAEGNESVLADFGLQNQAVFEQTFTLKRGNSTTIRVPLKAPMGLRDVTVRVFAQTDRIGWRTKDIDCGSWTLSSCAVSIRAFGQ